MHGRAWRWIFVCFCVFGVFGCCLTHVSQGSASSAPAGMVSGNDGAVNAGTTPVYHMGDPLQGSGDPWAGTAPWLSFNTGVGGR